MKRFNKKDWSEKKLKPCPPRLLNKLIKEYTKVGNREIIILLFIVDILKARGYHI